MESRVVRAGFQRALRLRATNAPRTLPLRQAWSRPAPCTSGLGSLARAAQLHSSAVRRVVDKDLDKYLKDDSFTSEPEEVERTQQHSLRGSRAVEEGREMEAEEEQEIADLTSELSSAELADMAAALEDGLHDDEPDIPTPQDEDLRALVDDPSASLDGSDAPHLRLVPASPSYFTAQPRFTDDTLKLLALVRQCTTLPRAAPGEAPRVNWITYTQYTASNTEPIRKSRYAQLLRLLQRLNQIHPALVPPEVTAELARWKRAVQPAELRRRPNNVDIFGRARALGRRKESHAVVWLVEGDGQVRVNGRALPDMFGRLHDRESALWPLKATSRVDRYNVWAVVRGGGTTGQAEAMTLGLAKALLVHEPALKPALRRAGCVRTDPRQVERKKAGHLKARKMPTWVAR